VGDHLGEVLAVEARLAAAVDAEDLRAAIEPGLRCEARRVGIEQIAAGGPDGVEDAIAAVGLGRWV
jgi:hypothetical protein